MAKKLSYKDFLKSFSYAPRLTIELVIENDKGELLFIERVDEPYKGMWHLPGGFLLKDEKISECIKRVAKEELHIDVDPKKVKQCRLFETLKGDFRGHIIHLPVKIKVPNVSLGRYFANIPQNTVSYQESFLKELGYS